MDDLDPRIFDGEDPLDQHSVFREEGPCVYRGICEYSDREKTHCPYFFNQRTTCKYE